MTHLLTGVEGVVEDLPDRVYHSDVETLSSTGARKILRSPARFKWDLDHPSPYKRQFEIGHAAHTMVLSAGAAIERIDADSYRTKDARHLREEALAEGKTPLLPREYDQVTDMYQACLDHPVVGKLIERDDLVREASMFWLDGATGAACRARPDLATADWSLLIDYKTTVDASPVGFAKSLGNFWYHCQQSWYQDAVEHFTGISPMFVFIAQEKTPPYQVGIYELDPVAVEIAQAMNHKARTIWKTCVETGEWPGYTPNPVTIALPAWAERSLSQEYIDD